MITNLKKFDEFLYKTFGQKEISLIIAKNNEEMNNFVQELDNRSYAQSKNPSELLENIKNFKKTFYVLDESIGKDIYDILVQFPTGQIEIFDKASMESEVIHPNHDNLSIIFLAEEKMLNHIQKKKFDILSNVGLTYRD